MPLLKGSCWADNSLQEDIYLNRNKEIAEIALGCSDLIFSFINAVFNFSSVSNPPNLVCTAFGSISTLDDAPFASACLKQVKQQDGFSVH